MKFEEVISILPQVFMKDGHMIPQNHANHIVIKKLGIQVKISIHFEKVFKLESRKDLIELYEIFVSLR